MSLTAALVDAHHRHTAGKGYGDGPGLTNCCITVEAVLADVYGLEVKQRHADLMIFDRSRPWSPVEAVVELGIGIEVDDAPTPGRWHVCQGWQSLHAGEVGPGDRGHTFLWWEPTQGAGRILEANVRYPWDRLLTWADQVARYRAGVRVAVLVEPVTLPSSLIRVEAAPYVEPLSRDDVEDGS